MLGRSVYEVEQDAIALGYGLPSLARFQQVIDVRGDTSPPPSHLRVQALALSGASNPDAGHRPVVIAFCEQLAVHQDLQVALLVKGQLGGTVGISSPNGLSRYTVPLEGQRDVFGVLHVHREDHRLAHVGVLEPGPGDEIVARIGVDRVAQLS